MIQNKITFLFFIFSIKGQFSNLCEDLNKDLENSDSQTLIKMQKFSEIKEQFEELKNESSIIEFNFEKNPNFLIEAHNIDTFRSFFRLNEQENQLRYDNEIQKHLEILHQMKEGSINGVQLFQNCFYDNYPHGQFFLVFRNTSNINSILLMQKQPDFQTRLQSYIELFKTLYNINYGNSQKDVKWLHNFISPDSILFDDNNRLLLGRFENARPSQDIYPNLFTNNTIFLTLQRQVINNFYSYINDTNNKDEINKICIQQIIQQLNPPKESQLELRQFEILKSSNYSKLNLFTRYVIKCQERKYQKLIHQLTSLDIPMTMFFQHMSFEDLYALIITVIVLEYNLQNELEEIFNYDFLQDIFNNFEMIQEKWDTVEYLIESFQKDLKLFQILKPFLLTDLYKLTEEETEKIHEDIIEKLSDLLCDDCSENLL